MNSPWVFGFARTHYVLEGPLMSCPTRIALAPAASVASGKLRACIAEAGAFDACLDVEILVGVRVLA